MVTIIIFIFAAVGISYWWLLRQRVLEKPWMTEGTGADRRDDIASLSPTAKTGLFIFLAVVTSMFSLFISAYFMRMELNDWRPLSEPRLLWFNTLLLILGSLFPGRPDEVVLRGGGWGNDPYCLRSAYRHGNPPDIGLDMVGFRCAGDAEEALPARPPRGTLTSRLYLEFFLK